MSDTSSRRVALLSWALAAALTGCGGGQPAADPGPVAVVDRSSLEFATAVGVLPEPEVLKVSGVGTLGAPTVRSSTYLFSATVEGSTAPFTVRVSTDAVYAPGSYVGTLTITFAGAGGGTLSVPLALTVVEPLAQPATAACATAGTSMCLELSSTCGPALVAFEQECASGGITTCPAAGMVGGCRVQGGAGQYTHWYYAPGFTAAGAKPICATALGGAWVDP